MTASASTLGFEEDQAYVAHHFNCLTYCAAGRSGGKQTRCADGLQLWDTYNLAARSLIARDHPPKKSNLRLKQ